MLFTHSVCPERDDDGFNELAEADEDICRVLDLQDTRSQSYESPKKSIATSGSIMRDGDAHRSDMIQCQDKVRDEACPGTYQQAKGLAKHVARVQVQDAEIPRIGGTVGIATSEIQVKWQPRRSPVPQVAIF